MGYNQKMFGLGSRRSIIREIFEYSKTRAKEIGAENVFDFSLGNPSVPAPAIVNDSIRELLDTQDSVLLHGYTSAQGDLGVRTAIAEHIKARFDVPITPNHIYMTCGAAASLSICLKALIEPEHGDECIVFAPFFTEYRVFIENAGGKLVVSMPEESSFAIDIADFEAKINEKTKAIILNSPNNPSGVVYSEETVKAVCEVLRRKSAEFGNPIYLIADEPYRELVYSDVQVPYLMNHYANTLVCYSYSKALSLPGERIGYIAVCPEMEDAANIYLAVCGAGRSLGYVCAPSLFQQVIAKCVDATVDIEIYRENRDLLYNNLTAYGYHCIKPDGAFYLFVKAPEPDAYAFYEKAKAHELLVVPCDDFGTPGYVRIAYCVDKARVLGALPAFKTLAQEYGFGQ
ncbi:MAG: pyridoxal phosphate-dependent aminotransferase [Ruminococcaceae bacterium]|nr:pyridoxal phosphate-dependent aminotransferase [Oscillospiraceae bacterium]